MSISGHRTENPMLMPSLIGMARVALRTGRATPFSLNNGACVYPVRTTPLWIRCFAAVSGGSSEAGAPASAELAAGAPMQTHLTIERVKTSVDASSAAPTFPGASLPPLMGATLQSVDCTTLAACVAELQRDWLPSKVEQAIQVEDHLLALRLRSLQGCAWLYLSWHPTSGHLAVSEDGPVRGGLAEAFQFGEQVSSLARGLVLTNVCLPHRWERVVQLSLAPRPAEAPSVSLICEIMGRYSNVVVTDGGGNVLAAGHQVGSKMSSMRLVQVGRPYALPPPPPGIDPDACGTFEEWRNVVMLAARQAAARNGRAVDTVVGGIVRGFRGSSPALAKQLCEAACIASSATPQELSAENWQHLHEQWLGWLCRLQSGDFACTVSSCGAYSMLGGQGVEENSALRFMRTYYSHFQQGDDFGRVKSRIQRALTSAVQRLQKKIYSLQKQGACPDTHLATQRAADLLMANVHCIPQGAAVARVEDWDEPGAMVDIPLDPQKSAIATAEALYAKARKQRRAVGQVAPLIAGAQSQLDYLLEVEVMLSQLSGSEDAAALREVEIDLVAGGYVKPPPGEQLAAKAASKARRASKRGSKQQGSSKSGSGADSTGYRRYESPGGLTVLVGRNSRQNDELTMRKTQPSDIWMHARGVPGAHLLLRVPSGQEAGEADVQFAADIAAFFSKARNEGKADVTCARPADISKPRGAKLGQVMVKKEFVVIGRPGKSFPALQEGAS